MFEKAPNINSDNDFERESLENEQLIEEVNLDNLNVSDLQKIQEIMLLREEILGKSYKASEKYQRELEEFLKDIQKAYPHDDLEKIALVHILKGSEIPGDVQKLDLEGEYSIEGFLKELQNEIEEGTL